MSGIGPTREETAVYLAYSQAELDRAYDQRAWAADADVILAGYKEASAAIRLKHSHHADLAYGTSPNERLDWFAPAEPTGGPIHVHIHGGAWRALSKHDVSFVAPAFVSAGVHFVAPDFVSLPDGRLTDMVDQLVAAVGFIRAKASEFGADPDRIVMSGHSSGAHLAAVLMTRDWETYGLPADILKGCLCISGTYDMEPVLLSARRSYIQLNSDEARALSPVHHLERIRQPLALAYGGRESPEFIRQTKHFSRALTRTGIAHDIIFEPDANHFGLANDLARPGSSIHQLALRHAAVKSA